jgi:hypothetical protein
MRASSSGVTRVLAGAFLALVARFALPAFAARAFDLRDVFAIGLLLAVWISSGSSPAFAGTEMQVIHQPEIDCKAPRRCSVDVEDVIVMCRPRGGEAILPMTSTLFSRFRATCQDLERADEPLHRGLDVVSRPAPNREQDNLLADDSGDDRDAFRLRRAAAASETVEAL